MRSTHLLFMLGLGLAAAQPVLAQDTVSWIGAPDCRLAAVKPAPAEPPTWRGACKDGFADGKGVLEWKNKDGDTYSLAGTFLAGQVQGEGTLNYADGTVYTGTFSHNRENGKAYIRFANGDQYEGDIRMGEADGVGEMLYADGDDYKGQWKSNKRNGIGTMRYAAGGSYEGGWKDDEWSGQGKLVYAGGQGRETATVDGRDPHRRAATPSKQSYTVKHDEPSVGTAIRSDAALAVPVPPARGYDELSPQERAVVDSWYPTLAPGDEPPYPLHGPAEFYKVISKVGGRLLLRGKIRIDVSVGKDGKAARVRAVGLTDPEARNIIATAAGLVQYKPARCAGQPCEMPYSYSLALTLD